MSTTLETTTEIGFDSAGLRMTPEEFDAIEDYDELYRYELVDGVLVVNPIPLEASASPNEYLGYLLHDYKHRHPKGSALDSTLPKRYVRVANGRRLADRVVWTGLGRLPDSKVDVPTIAVEFVSAGKRNRRRDYEEKTREYRAAGVVEYWIVDRFDRRMTVHRNGGTEPETLVVEEGDVYRTDLLPGFELVLKDLLARSDQWNQ